MAKFMCRVELHEKHEHEKIPKEEYDKLHELMASINFLQIIQDSKTNQWHELPRAEYRIESTVTIDQIDALIRITLVKLERNFSYIVFEYFEARWLNLKPTPPKIKNQS